MEQSCCPTVKPTMLIQLGGPQIKVTVCICQGVHRGIPSTL